MWAAFAVLALLMAAAPELAWAQVDTIGQAADHVVDAKAFDRMWDLISGISYLAGCFFGVKAALQLKEHNDSPGQTKLSKPVMTLVVSGLLMSFPQFVNMVQATFAMTQGGAVFDQSSGGSNGSAQTFVALASSIPGMMRIASYVAITVGAFFLLRALFMLPQVEQGREPMGKVIWMVIAGVGLWSLMPMINMSMATLGMNAPQAANILTQKYSAAGGGGFEGTIAAVLAFVQFLGLIAFIRGMMILKALGENKDGAMGRALTHILGGSAAMNIGWTIKLLAMSIGASSSVCGLAATMCS